MSTIYFDTQLLSKYRSQLMGIATLMIIACHAPASGVVLPCILTRILELGNYGVDMFLFLSGLGCYYSLSKCKAGYGEYWVRRIKRVLIPYLIVSIPFSVFYLIVGRDSILDTFYWLTTLEYWLFHKGAWFVSLMIPLYLVSPLVYKVTDANKYSWLYACLLIILIFILICLPSSNLIINNFQFALSRVPNFIMGMSIAPLCSNRQRISILWVLPFFVVYVVFSALHLGYIGWAIIPLLTLILLLLIRCFSKSYINIILSFLGRISLESYLTNIYINSMFVYLIPTYVDSKIFYGRYLEYAMVIVLGITWAYINNIVVELIKRKHYA